MTFSAVAQLRTGLVDLYLDRFAAAPPENPAWHLSAEDLRGVRVRWPRVYEWDAAGDWVDGIRNGFRRYVPVEPVDDIPQEHKGTVHWEFVRNGRVHQIAIAYSDYPQIDGDGAVSSDLYFKMQFAREGYGLNNVVPGGYVPDGKRLYYHLPKLRKLRDARTCDHDVYGRFSLNYAREIREAAVDRLSRQAKFNFEGGMKTVSYLDFLYEAARSKICIDMPGLGPFCFRLVNYLAVGSCIIAYPHAASMHVPLVDRKHIVYCKPDMSDLVELCEYYLGHEEEREAIAANAREYFDTYLHKDNLVRYYLRTCLDRLV